MGIITRHANAPFADGEILAGTDLEHDFATVYDAFNGSISSANLADLAVTTAKLAANAVTQGKMTTGAASASEAQIDTGLIGQVFTAASFVTVGSPMTHTVGNPARHVIIMVSLKINRFFALVPVGAIFQLLKDGVNLYPNADDVCNDESPFTRTYVDTSPTPGGTHVYTLKCKGDTGGGFVLNLAIVVFEPRS